jgi:hypothetical protein
VAGFGELQQALDFGVQGTIRPTRAIFARFNATDGTKLQTYVDGEITGSEGFDQRKVSQWQNTQC